MGAWIYRYYLYYILYYFQIFIFFVYIYTRTHTANEDFVQYMSDGKAGVLVPARSVSQVLCLWEKAWPPGSSVPAPCSSRKRSLLPWLGSLISEGREQMGAHTA